MDTTLDLDEGVYLIKRYFQLGNMYDGCQGSCQGVHYIYSMYFVSSNTVLQYSRSLRSSYSNLLRISSPQFLHGVTLSYFTPRLSIPRS